MSSQNAENQRKLLIILSALVILIGISTYFLYDLLRAQQKDSVDMVISEGWTSIGNDIMVSSGTANMTLVTSEGKGMLVDTGYKADEARRIKDYIDKNGIVLEGIILTHMHNDHTANLKMFMNDGAKLYKPADLEEGQEIVLGNKRLRVLITDGHTPKNSHVSIEVVEDNILIAGDVVLTDGLPAVGGSYIDLIASLKRIDSKGYSIIVPGHGAIVESSKAAAKNLEYLENAGKLVEELVSTGGALPLVESISIKDCVSGLDGQEDELLMQVHRFNLTNIYQQVKLEKGK